MRTCQFRNDAGWRRCASAWRRRTAPSQRDRNAPACQRPQTTCQL